MALCTHMKLPVHTACTPGTIRQGGSLATKPRRAANHVSSRSSLVGARVCKCYRPDMREMQHAQRAHAPRPRGRSARGLLVLLRRCSATATFTHVFRYLGEVDVLPLLCRCTLKWSPASFGTSHRAGRPAADYIAADYIHTVHARTSTVPRVCI
jgi:hypothetical protein